MKFSIIIPVRAINDFIKESVAEIKKLQYSEFETIIVVDSPTDYNFEDSRFQVLSSGSISPGEKRNLGAKAATGDILVFLDDDAFPASDWLLEASKIFENPEVYALGGPAITPFNASLLERISGRVLESFLVSGGTTYRHKVTKERFINDYPTVNLFVRKDAFIKVGGFSSEFWPGEDTKLCLDLVDYYKRPFIYSPKPVVFHHRRNLFRPYLKQISRYGMYRGRFARVFPQTSRLPMYFIPSLFLIFAVYGAPLSVLFSPFTWIYKYIMGIYLLFVLIESFRAYFKDSNPASLFLFFFGAILTHIVYGFNFIIGFVVKPKLQLKSVDTKTGNYNEG